MPRLLDLEVVQVVRRARLADRLGERRAAEAVDDLAALPFRREPHDVLLDRIWELRTNLTSYDAEALDATLVTRDRRLATVAAATVAVRGADAPR